MQMQTIVGPSVASDGALTPLRGGKQGDGIVTELHGRFYEQTYRNNIFHTGLGVATSIANATFTTADGLSSTLATAATSTPIIGLWNPSSSNVNAVILQATLSAFITASTVTGCGGLVWCSYLSNPNITVANQQVPVNGKTLSPSGSQCRGLSTIALTGLANVGIAIRASALGCGPASNYSQVGTAVGFPATVTGPNTENIDGSIIVPPGGILALYAITTPAAISVVPGLMWEEVPV
jgi:hypothetical protein